MLLGCTLLLQMDNLHLLPIYRYSRAEPATSLRELHHLFIVITLPMYGCRILEFGMLLSFGLRCMCIVITLLGDILQIADPLCYISLIQ